MRNSIYCFIILLLIYPALESCVDPVGIENNIQKKLLSLDTIIVSDTIYFIDSIFVVRLDTIIVNRDSIIYNDSNNQQFNRRYHQIKHYSMNFYEIIENDMDSAMNWNYYEGLVRIESDTNLTIPSLNMYIDVSRSVNFDFDRTRLQYEYTAGFRLYLNGYIPSAQLLRLNGSQGNNKYAELKLTNSKGIIRSINGDDNLISIRATELNYNYANEKLISCKIELKGKFRTIYSTKYFVMNLIIREF